MRQIILMSHGPLAHAIRQSAELIAGPISACYTWGIELDTNIEDIKNEIVTLLRSFKETDQVVVLCDILGGSPSNIILHLLEEFPNIQAFTGMNLGLVLELVLNPECDDLVTSLRQNYLTGFNHLTLQAPSDNDDELDL